MTSHGGGALGCGPPRGREFTEAVLLRAAADPQRHAPDNEEASCHSERCRMRWESPSPVSSCAPPGCRDRPVGGAGCGCDHGGTGHVSRPGAPIARERKMPIAAHRTRNRAAPVPPARRFTPWLAASAALLVWSAGAAQSVAGGYPFQPGEACAYQGSGPLGRMGSGTFAVERQDSAGREAYLLRFDFRGRLGFVGVENHTRSYFDPA